MNDKKFDIFDEDDGQAYDEYADVVSRSRNPFSFVYKNIVLLGIFAKRGAKKIFKYLFKLLARPLRVIWAWVRILAIALDYFWLRSVHSFSQEWKYLRLEIRSAMQYLTRAARKHPGSLIHILFHYVVKALRRHKQFFKSALNYIIPMAAIAVLVLTVGYWNGVTYALEVIYNDTTIGYISDESVYIESRNLANEKLSIGLGETERDEMLGTPHYSLALVSVNKLVDVTTLCDNLLDASQADITNACGIYIDGEFLCSVKNENDARSVFSSILEKQSITSPSEKVGFIEEIEYVQGLYPDNERSMWDAQRLSEVLGSTKQGTLYHTAQYGDSFSKIADEYDMTVEKLKAMNKQLGDSIMVGDKIVVSQEVKYIRVKVVRTEQHAQDVDFTTEVSYSSALFKGDSRVVREGKQGLDLVTTQVTLVDGVIYSTEEIERYRITDPVSKKIEQGTKSTYVSSGSYNITVSKKGFVWPAPSAHTISQRYGRNGHKGIDITTSGASGKAIVAAASGTVEIAGSTGDSYGLQILINHGNGVKTRYAHCLSGSISVRAGQKVSAGQQIARIGSTGNSTGPHLHFEVISNGSLTNPLNYVSS